MKQCSSKKRSILFLLFTALSIISIYAQTPQVTEINAGSGSANGARPLAGQTYNYKISMSGGTGSTYVQLTCENGVFANNQKTYNTTVSGSFEVPVTWGDSGTGKITAVSGNSYKATYARDIEQISIPVAGPAKILYGGVGTYNIGSSINPNISVYSLKWENSSELKEVGSSATNVVVGAVNNKSQVLTNGIKVVARTNFGNLTGYMTISIEAITAPLSIRNAVSFACYNENINYSLEGFPAGATITWTGSNADLISGQGTPYPVFKTNPQRNGYATVTAAVTHQGKTQEVKNSNVWVGVPDKPTIQGFGSTPPVFPGRSRNSFRTYAIGADPTNGYIYSISGAASISQILTGGDIIIETNNVTYDSPFTLEVTARNKCGQSIKYYASGIVKGSGGGDEPPAIEMRGNFSIVDLKDQSEIKSVRIYNLSGAIVYSDNAVNGNFDIKSTVLSDGIYIIEKFDGENRTSEKVILKR